MKELKIGHLLFRKKSIQLIALGFFINGVILGGFVTTSALGGLDNALNIFWLMALLLITWIPLRRPIKDNIVEKC